jgi:Ca2+-binding EF-hand superfamily protein
MVLVCRHRLIDLFRELDTDNSGSITVQELKEGLKRAAIPSAAVRAKAKLKAEKQMERSKEAARENIKLDLLKTRFRCAPPLP